jgi:hypothetical protein
MELISGKHYLCVYIGVLTSILSFNGLGRSLALHISKCQSQPETITEEVAVFYGFRSPAIQSEYVQQLGEISEVVRRVTEAVSSA